MVLLPKIQEAAIVDNLKKRLMDDLIFVSFSFDEIALDYLLRVSSRVLLLHLCIWHSSSLCAPIVSC